MIANRDVQVPRLLRVARGCLSEIPRLLTQHGFDLTQVCVVTGPSSSRRFADRVVAGLQDADVAVQLVPDLTGTLAQAAALASSSISEGWTTILAVGGGRVIDTGKLAAARTGIDFVSVPTTVAHDGVSSPVASLVHTDGRRQSFAARMPAGVVLDTEVLTEAPVRSLRAGVGDLISNLTALSDWRLADKLGKDHYDEFSGMIADAAARPALDFKDLTDDATMDRLAQGLVLSGLAMATAGTSRPCSGSEHLVSHSLDRILGTEASMHGEQVALGTLVSAAAHGVLLDEIRDVFIKCGLPICPADLGIERDVMRRAVQEAPGTRPDRYTVLSDAVDTLEAADELCTKAFGAGW